MPKRIRIQVSKDTYDRLTNARDLYGFRSIQRMLRAMAVTLERRWLEAEEAPDEIKSMFDAFADSPHPDGDAPVRHNNRNIETL